MSSRGMRRRSATGSPSVATYEESVTIEGGKQKAESGKRKAESRKQKAESRKQKVESGKRKAESRSAWRVPRNQSGQRTRDLIKLSWLTREQPALARHADPVLGLV